MPLLSTDRLPAKPRVSETSTTSDDILQNNTKQNKSQPLPLPPPPTTTTTCSLHVTLIRKLSFYCFISSLNGFDEKVTDKHIPLAPFYAQTGTTISLVFSFFLQPLLQSFNRCRVGVAGDALVISAGLHIVCSFLFLLQSPILLSVMMVSLSEAPLLSHGGTPALSVPRCRHIPEKHSQLYHQSCLVYHTSYSSSS